MHIQINRIYISKTGVEVLYFSVSSLPVDNYASSCRVQKEVAVSVMHSFTTLGKKVLNTAVLQQFRAIRRRMLVHV